MHYFIIIVVVIGIVIYQIRVFKDTKKRILIFSNLFPKTASYAFRNDVLIAEIQNASVTELFRMLNERGIDEKKVCNQFEGEDGVIEYVLDEKKAKRALLKHIPATNEIYSSHKNPIFKEILQSINNYLSNNKGSVSDFHLMKDIVDRNCDAADDEISTQIPVPLYLGLTGTMIGILVGVGYLWLSGDLDALLNASASSSGATGVKALLGGVALAMISSINGILLTTLGSIRAKNAKSETEHRKHIFLSWMQANLLPTLNNDTAQTLERMSKNLVAFNATFSENTSKLDSTLSQVNRATVLQKQLLDSVSKIADKDVTTQNVKIYNSLKNCSEEIVKLSEYLNNTTEYLNNVRALNEKLDKNELRFQTLEKMLEYFEKETEQIEQRKLAVSKVVGEIDSKLEDNLRLLGEHASGNVEKFNVALGKQQEALQTKLDETHVLLEELRNISTIKSSISKFENAVKDQNRKIDNLTMAIKQLAESKQTSSANAMPQFVGKKSSPTWKKILLWSLGILIGISSVVLIVANWSSISDFINLFKF